MITLLAKAIINQKIELYGAMTRLEIDSTNKTIRLSLELKGEPAPIEIEVGAYSLEELDGKILLSIHNITTSREWLTGLANEYLINRRIPVPKAAAIAL